MSTKVLKVAVTQGKKILEQKLISSRDVGHGRHGFIEHAACFG